MYSISSLLTLTLHEYDITMTQATARTNYLTPHPIDLYVGQRLRAQRIMMGMSQEKLALAVGITFQQVQKYERGVNRISASRLYEFSQALGIHVGYFFEGYEENTTLPLGLGEDRATFIGKDDENREVLDLIRIYKGIHSHAVRRQVISLVRSVAASVDEKEVEIV